MFLYGWMRFPVTGSVWNMLVDMLLLVISSEAMGVAIIGLVPVCRLAMSVGSILSVLSFSFTGFTLPVEAMPAALRGFSFLFPLRYYYLFEVQEVFFGSGIAGWWHYLLVPLAYVLIALLTVPRLGRAYRDQNYSLN
jgi:ABC-2 type transport system permease protein